MSRHLFAAGPIGIGPVLVFALLLSPPALVAADTPSTGDPIRVRTWVDDLATNRTCSLREAVRAANLDQPVDGCHAGHGADVIILDAGLYAFRIAGIGEDDGATGDLDIWADLEIRGAGRSRTIIDGASLDRVLDIHGSHRVRLSSLTITGGKLSWSDTGPWDGAGILNRGHLALTDVLITGNEAPGAGGGIANPGTLSMVDCRVTRNMAGPDAGGGGILSTGSATLMRVTVTDNISASSGARDEGAAGIASTGALVIDSSVVARNQGAGEWTPGGVSARHGRIVRTTIRGNQGGSFGTGGAVLTDARLIASSVIGNVGGADGGAGGVLAIDSTILNSTISGNRAGGFYGTGGPWANAGGVYAIRSRIVASTITDNFSDAVTGDPPAGGLHGEVGTHVLGTILAGNRGPDGQGQDCGGTVVSDGWTLVRDPSACDLHTRATDLVGVAPRLRPLADNGGPTLTRMLRAGSPAIDAWPVLTRSGRATGCPASDQRGVTRPQRGLRVAACDIGAVEVAARR